LADGTGGQGERKKGSAGVGVSEARELRKRAALDEEAGRLDRAYGRTLEAWNLARGHPDDADAEAFVETLQGDLARLRDKLNGSAKTPPPEKTIRVR
jgi:hypothetical protein